MFVLRPDHWERLKIDLPDDWNCQELRLEPGNGFGLLEIAGVRIISRVMGNTLWELLGRDLLTAIHATPATQLVSSTRRLRLLCTDGDTEIWLPEVRLPATGGPLTLELGLRVRTGFAQITHVLHAWVDEADTRCREATEQAAGLREERDRELRIAREYLTALEMARTDGSQCEAALKKQLASAHEAAEQHAAVLLTEIDNARADGDRRETAVREQMAAAQQASEQHALMLRKEIDNARAHGDERAADLKGAIDRMDRQLNETRGHLEQIQAQLVDAQDRWQQSERALTVIRQEHATVRAELAVESGANAVNQGRIHSMQHSFSWKITLPLRVLGRMLTGRKTAGGRRP